MNLFAHFRQQIIDKIKGLYKDISSVDDIVVELPKEASHGDIATNAAMVLKAQLGQNPRQIADFLVGHFKGLPQVEEVTVAGPGFINFRLNAAVWQQVANDIVTLGNRYGNCNIGQNKKINVEFVSINPTGPMHIGHSRAAVMGDALAKLLKKCGYNVVKEYYINDAGGQIITLANSVFIRYKQALGLQEEITEGMYPGDYLIPLGQALKEKYKDQLLSYDEHKRFEIIREFAVEKMMELIKADLEDLGVSFDVFTSEKKDLHAHGKIEEAIKFLEDKGLLYKGVLEPPKGKLPDDWEPREQLLFKSTLFGDDIDRSLQKSDGTHTYLAADVAYHKYKIDRGFKEMVLLLGADHSGYVKRIKAIVAALSDNHANIDIKINQLVNFYQNGEPLKMSKRTGNFITVKDVLEEVGKDILRFVMLLRKPDTVFDFDLEKVKEQSKDNPVFYVQYAHARACSILRTIQEKNINFTDANLTKLQHKLEINLLKRLAEFPKVVESASLVHEPHRIAYYLTELANEFHSFWSYGNDEESLRFIVPEDLELTKARVFLVKAVANVIAAGFDILGVKPVERM